MIYVNLRWLDYIWGSIGGDIEHPDLSLKDMKDFNNFSLLINRYLRPSLDNFPPRVLQLLKGTWKFAINTYTDETLERSFESNLPPFELPGRPREFYIKVWEALFPNESWHLQQGESFSEINNSHLDPWEWIEESKSVT
jgi:hypothetical protein